MQTITKNKVKEIFGLSESSIVNYINSGILKLAEYNPFDSNTVFDRKHICEIIGLKDLPDEPFITAEEALKILDLPDGYRSSIRPYCKSRKLPYYNFKNARGSKTYFLRSELEAAMKYNIEWGTEFPDFVVRNNFMRDIFKQVFAPSFSKSLNENEVNVLNEVVLNKKNITQASESLNMSNEYARIIFISACHKISLEIKNANDNLSQMALLLSENTKQLAISRQLKIENDSLIKKINSLTNSLSKKNKSKKQIDIDNLIKPFSNNLPVKVFGALRRLEANNLSDLSNFRRSEVEKYQGIGKKTINSLEELLLQNKLNWKEEEEGYGTPTILPKKKKKKYTKTDLRDVKTRIMEIESKEKN